MEFELRVWDKKNQEYEYISDMYWFEENFVHSTAESDLYIFEQFTHNTSVDTRKLFAGDIIRYQADYFKQFSKISVDFISAITWKDGEGACVVNPENNQQINISLDIKTMTWGNLHHLGNIHEHASLIKGEQQ